MLKKVCSNVIKTQMYNQEDMQLKLDVFWAGNKLTQAEYEELCALMLEYPPIAA